MNTKNEEGFITIQVSNMPDTPSIDGLTYSRQALEKAVELFNARPYVFGEINSLQQMKGASLLRMLTVDETNVSQQAKNFRMTDDGVVADVKIMPTPMGAVVQRYMNEGRFERGEVAFRIRCLVPQFGMDGNVVKHFAPVSVDLVNLM